MQREHGRCLQDNEYKQCASPSIAIAQASSALTYRCNSNSPRRAADSKLLHRERSEHHRWQEGLDRNIRRHHLPVGEYPMVLLLPLIPC